MEDDLDMEDNNPFAEGMGALDARGAYSSLLQQMPGVLQEEQAERQRIAASLAERYKIAEEAIRQQRFGAPTTSQQLAALSQALIAPRRMRGFAGTLDNILPALTAPAGLRAEAETKREAALRQLREQYDVATDAAGLAGIQARRAAIEAQMKGLAPLVKPNTAAAYAYAPDRGGYVPKPGIGDLPPMPKMDAFGNYVIEFQQQIEYLPPNTRIVLPGGDPNSPRFTPVRPTR